MPIFHAGKRRRLPLAAAGFSAALIAACTVPGDPMPADELVNGVRPALWPEQVAAPLSTPGIERRIDALMAQMTVREKVGQMIQGDISTIDPDDLRDYPLGSILAGGNSAPGGDDHAPAQAWLDLADAFYDVAMQERPGHQPIPPVFGIDAVHGHNNIVGATLFPHNIGLGATRDPELVRRIGEVTAREVAATGLDWAFAPTLAVVRDDRWGRSYEGYSEDPELVRAFAAPIVEGLQGRFGSPDFMSPERVAASAKHFLGDGGTHNGVDQGDTRVSEAELVRLHNAGYPPALQAGALYVMISFSAWNGEKLSGHRGLIETVLKQRMGFEGVAVSDWNAHAQLPNCSKVSCPAAFMAGIDMMMAADGWQGLFDNTLAQVESGELPMARVDDAVRRILRVKFVSGLFELGRPSERPLAGHFEELGKPAHRALARDAARRSMVLLKNNGGLLPLQGRQQVLVAGEAADDIARQNGGWTLSWQGTGSTRDDFPNATSILEGLREAVEDRGGQLEYEADGRYRRKPDVAIVVFGETPYAEFQGDIDTLEFQPGEHRDLALLQRLRDDGIPVVSVFLSGRPLWVNPEINASQAFVAAWLPGGEGAAVADLLFRDETGAVAYDFSGTLSFSWPRSAAQNRLNVGDADYDPLFAYGYGLRYASPAEVPELSEVSGVDVRAKPNLDDYYQRGRASAPWALSVGDAEGERQVAASQEQSPGGAIRLRSVDAEAQEDAKLAHWNGQGEGRLFIHGEAVDLRRQANGDMALTLAYRVVEPAAAAVGLRLSCGDGCDATLDAGRLFAEPSTEWHTARIKLGCFAEAGADLARVDRPFELRTAGRLQLQFKEISLSQNSGDAICLPGLP